MEKKYKVIEEQLVAQVIELIATAHTSLNYMQMNQLFKQLSELPSATDEAKPE